MPVPDPCQCDCGDQTGDHRALFVAHGLRCTRQRQVVYTALAASREHPTAEALYEAVRSSPDAAGAGISLATVYNTLETLTQRGLCRKIATPGGPCRYDALTHEHAHVLTADGSLVDLPEDLSDRVMASVRDPELIAEIEERLGVKVGRIGVQLAAE